MRKIFEKNLWTGLIFFRDFAYLILGDLERHNAERGEEIMAGCTTPSFVFEVKLQTSKEQENTLNKRFKIAGKVKNVVISHAQKKLNQLNGSKRYHELRQQYHELSEEIEKLEEKIGKLPEDTGEIAKRGSGTSLTKTKLVIA